MIEDGRLDEGIAELRQALDPSDPLAHYHLAGAHYLRGRPDLAAEEYRATLALDPASFPSLSNLAQLEIEAGIAELRLAARLAPWGPLIREHLDLALAEQGK